MDDKTINVVKPKTNRKYSKRLFITVGIAGLIALGVIGNSMGAGSANRPKRVDTAAPEELLSPAASPTDMDRYAIAEAEYPSAADIIAQEEKGRQNEPVATAGNQEQIQNRQQWLQFEQSVFTSRPEVQGNWNNVIDRGQTVSHGASPTMIEDAPFNRLMSEAEIARQIENQPTMSEKEKFFNASQSGKGYLSSSRIAPISPYVLPSGTVIPCTLLSGVNSDLPGNIVAQVTENVYDWVKHNVILIPQGTKVFGVYDSSVAFAQKRVQVSWTRLIFPDGSVLDLQGMAGVDKQGYSGLRDKHYAHYGRMLTAALLTAAFGSVGMLFDDDNNYSSSSGTVVVMNNNSAKKEVAKAIAEDLGEMGQKFFDKSLNVPPTILIRPATRFNILCNADVPFYESWK